MIRLLRTDGSTSEEPRATTATVQGDYLVCRDKLGLLVATFETRQVASFSDATGKVTAVTVPSVKGIGTK